MTNDSDVVIPARKNYKFTLGVAVLTTILASSFVFFEGGTVSSPPFAQTATNTLAQTTNPMNTQQFTMFAPATQNLVWDGWRRLNSPSDQLSSEEQASVMRANAGLSLRERAGRGDVVAAIQLLKYSQRCLSMPDNPELIQAGEPAGVIVLGMKHCLPFFGEDITSSAELSSLALDWYKLIAGTGFEPAASAYWSALANHERQTNKAVNADRQTRADDISLALSLLTSAAAKGDSDATWQLMSAYEHGILVTADPQLAAHFARAAAAVPENSANPWLRKLAQRE